MTGALDATARAVAGRLIDKYGKALTFTSAATTYDPDSDVVVGAGTEYEWNGVLDKFGRAYPLRVTEKHGMTIIYVPVVNTAGTVATFTPEAGWTVTVDAEEFRVVAVDEVKSGELGAMWILETNK
ncbi:MAG TPA: hypothetical protein VFG22_09245 [Polyangiales bacterium]|nr:hypothetical protein [Polyangiales bacterium]